MHSLWRPTNIKSAYVINRFGGCIDLKQRLLTNIVFWTDANRTAGHLQFQVTSHGIVMLQKKIFNGDSCFSADQSKTLKVLVCLTQGREKIGRNPGPCEHFVIYCFWNSRNVLYVHITCIILDKTKRIQPRHDKTNKMSVRPAKTQISLGVRSVWSESSLCAQWVAKDSGFLHVDSEDSDQTGRMIWVFAGRTAILLVLSCRGSVIKVLNNSRFTKSWF